VHGARFAKRPLYRARSKPLTAAASWMNQVAGAFGMPGSRRSRHLPSRRNDHQRQGSSWERCRDGRVALIVTLPIACRVLGGSRSGGMSGMDMGVATPLGSFEFFCHRVGVDDGGNDAARRGPRRVVRTDSWRLAGCVPAPLFVGVLPCRMDRGGPFAVYAVYRPQQFYRRRGRKSRSRAGLYEAEHR